MTTQSISAAIAAKMAADRKLAAALLKKHYGYRS